MRTSARLDVVRLRPAATSTGRRRGVHDTRLLRAYAGVQQWPAQTETILPWLATAILLCLGAQALLAGLRPHSVSCFNCPILTQPLASSSRLRGALRVHGRQNSHLIVSAGSATMPQESMKEELLSAIAHFKAVELRDGTASIDFGVRGGELNETSRAPRNLQADGAFRRVSSELGEAADKVLGIVDKLSAYNPTPDALEHFGTKKGKECLLDGRWELMFTTAADATFSKNSTRGDAKVANEVDAVRGRVTNCIDFVPRDAETKPTVESLRVRLAAKAASSSRLELVFKYVQVKVNRLFGLPLFGRAVTLTLPVPGPFITRVISFFTRRQPPKAYFDVLYLDSSLRVHRTGEGNIFVQQRGSEQA
mmetsp:Transcript_23683/g.54699  ORF Transcript_23683/g.54699 Transcript_23683/m.54699 type:complete len:365 (-) Transcript_23683:20-1114(-)